MTISQRKRVRYARREAMRLRQRALIAQAMARRLDLTLSQREVGDDCGMGQSAISDLEGIVFDLQTERTVTLDTFMAYADSLGLELRLEIK